MRTLRYFVRGTIDRLNEEPSQTGSSLRREVTDAIDFTTQLGQEPNPNIDALRALLRDNRESIVNDVRAAHARLGAGEGVVGDDIEIAVDARKIIIELLEKDAKMRNVRYPWRTALWICAYDAGTWDTVAYIENIANSSVALLGPLATPIRGLEKAAISAGKDWLQSASSGTLAGAAAGTAVLGLAAGHWKLHTRFAEWLTKVSDDLPFQEAWDLFSTKTMKNTLENSNDWDELFNSLVSESGENVSRTQGVYLAIKGGWKGYTYADFKTALDVSRRALAKVFSNPDALYNIPIYDSPPGPATRKLLGNIQVKKTVLTYTKSTDTALDYIKNATRKILSKAYVGRTHEAEAVSSAVDKIMSGQLASEALTGAEAAGEAAGTTTVLDDAVGRMMDVADNKEEFDSLISSRIYEAIQELRKPGAADKAFTWKPAPGALDITELPENFYPDPSNTPGVDAIRVAVKESKDSIKEFAKKCSIPIENITALGKAFVVWRGIKTGAKITARVFKYVMGTGVAYGIVNPAWNDSPEGLTVLEGAQYIADSKIRLDSVRAWENILSTEQVTTIQDRLALALGGADPENASLKWIEADKKLGNLLGTQCGGPEESLAPELIGEIIGLYRESMSFRERGDVRESRSTYNTSDANLLRQLMREILIGSRR